jgi:hypothetical protein
LRRRLLVATISLCFTCSPALAISEHSESFDSSASPAVAAVDPSADSSMPAQKDSASASSPSIVTTDSSGGSGTAKSTSTADALPAQVDAKDSAQESAKDIAKNSAPVSGIRKWTAFGTGFVVGTPVAMVRRTISQDVVGAGEMPVIGKSKNRVKIWTARAVLLPVCAIGGLVQGPMYSLEQSKKFSSTTPFSKDNFSLGHMDADW